MFILFHHDTCFVFSARLILRKNPRKDCLTSANANVLSYLILNLKWNSDQQPYSEHKLCTAVNAQFVLKLCFFALSADIYNSTWKQPVKKTEILHPDLFHLSLLFSVITAANFSILVTDRQVLCVCVCVCYIRLQYVIVIIEIGTEIQLQPCRRIRGLSEELNQFRWPWLCETAWSREGEWERERLKQDAK